MKKAVNRKLKSEDIDSNENGGRKESTHEIRKKIENILLEREQKKLWDL